MNYICPKCGERMIYDPIADKMVCLQCEDRDQYELSMKEDAQIESGEFDGAQYMEMHVYKCTSCGAQLMVNGQESATFCSFCGKPTIVFDRVSKEQKPDYIIPFKISESQALDLIKQRFKKGKYVPDEIKNPKIDKLRGIYIPYWLYTSYIRMKANISIKSGDKSYPYYRDAECTFENVTMDASRKLNDVLSMRLEPYDTSELQPFRPEYLSGFYADRYDVTAKEVEDLARRRCEIDMRKTMSASCSGNNSENGTFHDENIKYDVKKIDYALLPAWFLTFWYDNELYTILVNGQTGKIVGNVPIDKKRCLTRFAMTAVITCILTSYLMVKIAIADVHSTNGNIGNLNIVIMVIIGIIFLIGLLRWKYFNVDRARFKGKTTLQYVKGRQDKTWVR